MPNTSPTLTGLKPSVTFLQNIVNAEALILDSSVVVSDPSDSFGGGTLTVTGLLAEDTVAIANQGNGNLQIGISAGQVSYQGFQIGTVTGGNGAPLSVTFQDNVSFVSSAAVQAVIQALTYANSSNAPTASRTLIVTATDHVGLSTGGVPITVNVTAQTPQSDAPFFTGLDNSPTVVPGATPQQVLDNNATITAPKLEAINNYGGSTLTLVRHGGANLQDAYDGSGTGLDSVLLFPFPSGPGGRIVSNNVLHEVINPGPGGGEVAKLVGHWAEPTPGFGNPRGSLTITFVDGATSADVDAVLDHITFGTSFSGPTVIDFIFDDGMGGLTSGSITVNQPPTAVNDPPVNTVPGPLNTADATKLAIAGLAVSDPDAVSLTTTLHVEHGVVTVGAGGGATISGSGTATVTLSGSVAQIDAALGAANNVIYRSSLNFDGTDHLTMTSNDGGSSGSGGPLQDIDTVDIHVTGIQPVLTSVTASGMGITAGSGDLNAGYVVTLTASFNEAITVDTTGGTPTLSLNDGGVAAYTSGSGSSTLNFSYTVAAGQNTPDLAVGAAELNGGALHDAVGHTASLSAAVGNPAGTLQIDTIAPHLTDVSASIASGDLEAGSAVHFVFKFDEAVKVAGGTPTLSLNTGGAAIYDAAATSALGDASKLVFDYLVGAHDTGTPSLAITDLNLQGAALTDLAGNAPGFGHVSAAFGVSVGEIYAPPHPAAIVDHGFIVS